MVLKFWDELRFAGITHRGEIKNSDGPGPRLDSSRLVKTGHLKLHNQTYLSLTFGRPASKRHRPRVVCVHE